MKPNDLQTIISEVWNSPGFTEDRGYPDTSIFGDDWNDRWLTEERIRTVRSDENNSIPVFDVESPPIAGPVSQSKKIDALAFYYSYHFSRHHWGIYVKISGIWQIGNELMADGIDVSTSLALAQEFLIRHELGHFQSDIGITQLEVNQNKSLYIPGRKAITSASPGWDSFEEGLCTSLAVRTLKKNKKSLKSFLFGLPSGYSDWAIHTSKMDIHAWQQIFQNYLAPNDRASLLNGYVANSIAPKFFNEVPIYYINDLPNVPTASLFLSPISHILETEVFKKDLTRLCKGQPAYKKKWQTTQEKLKLNPVMVHLEKITQNYYSVQLDYEARVGLERSTNWIAIAADHHDKLYKRLNNRS